MSGEIKMETPQYKQRHDPKPHPFEQSVQAMKNSPIEQSPVVRKGIIPLLQFLIKSMNDWIMNIQAGALAYSLLLAFFPIIIALLSLFGLVFGSLGQTAKHALTAAIQQALPNQHDVAKGVIEAINNKALPHASGPLAIIALLVALIGGSRLFIVMENCFDLIYHQRPRPFLQQNIMALSMLVLFAILIPLMVLASSISSVTLTFLQQSVLQALPGGGFILSLSGLLGSLFVSWILFVAIYMVVPQPHISFRNSWRGAVVAAFALQIYLFVFPLYATHFLNSYIGQTGFALILVIFFYYFALILLLGAEVNAFFAEGIRQTPDNLAGMVHEETSHKAKPSQEHEQEAPPSHRQG